MSDSNNDVNNYGLTPNYACNLTALVLFSILWVVHTILGVYYKQWWFGIAFFIACGLEVAGYIGRFLSASNPYILNDFLVQIICLTLGPAFFMGGGYYQLAKFAMVFGPNVSRLKPMMYSYIFMSCDFLSIVIQAIGGAMAAIALDDNNNTDPGTHVMVAGLAIQVASMTLFIGFFIDFFISVFKARKAAVLALGPEQADTVFDPRYSHIRKSRLLKPFVAALSVFTLFIYIRCIYRTAELAEGWSGYLILHERYFLVLEALIVFLGVLSVTVFHPGFLFGKMHIPVEGLRKKTSSEDDNNCTDSSEDKPILTEP